VKRESARLLVVGVGGLGCAAAMALARSGIGAMGLCDDDDVDQSNLHRQILFSDEDVGASKLDAAARALRALGPGPTLHLHRERLLPENALTLVRQYDVVMEGSDNFATKFLTADACALARVPVVHASAVRWIGTTLAVGDGGRPCYRCLFEDLPEGDAPNCTGAGVMGPVVGLIAAAQVDLALAMIDGLRVEGQLLTFDGRTDVVRRRELAARPDCALCGSAPSIHRIEPEAYVSPALAG
jgi:molybdopterin/thiamine biosynthesis adenylyltransferase